MWWFVVWSDGNAVVNVHCCNTIAVVCLLNTPNKSSVCNNAFTQVKSAVFVIGSELPAHLHNHWMRNARMCPSAIAD